VTHPYHPLCGREFELLTHKLTWGEHRVYFYDEQGRLQAIPATWTDAVPVDSFVAVAATRALFRPDDLLLLADLIAAIKEPQGVK
jgi:hypothetical protein